MVVLIVSVEVAIRVMRYMKWRAVVLVALLVRFTPAGL